MAESDGAISDVMCTVINESSRTEWECALRCECRPKKTVKSLFIRVVLRSKILFNFMYMYMTDYTVYEQSLILHFVTEGFI